jgi:hypothetical protein
MNRHSKLSGSAELLPVTLVAYASGSLPEILTPQINNRNNE